MKRRYEDLIGRQFGRLTVIAYDHEEPKYRHYWRCKCACGKETVVLASHLKSGDCQSCGCSMGPVKHRESGTRLYHVWINMKSRCNNPNHPSYANYGGRGITVCQEWLNDFEAFRDWALSNGYSSDLTIDRIDNNVGYSPNNCRWATYTRQARNKRNNTNITFNGETHTVGEWSELTGINASTLKSRLNRGKWAVQKALTENAVLPHKMIMLHGETRCVADWAKLYGLDPRTLRYRIAHGQNLEQALTAPVSTNYSRAERRTYTYNGYSSHSLKDLCRHFGVSYDAIYTRMRRYAMSLDEAMAIPVLRNRKRKRKSTATEPRPGH